MYHTNLVSVLVLVPSYSHTGEQKIFWFCISIYVYLVSDDRIWL